jgi:hypothetical protein
MSVISQPKMKIHGERKNCGPHSGVLHQVFFNQVRPFFTIFFTLAYRSVNSVLCLSLPRLTCIDISEALSGASNQPLCRVRTVVMSDHAGDSSAVILYYNATPIESIDSRTHRTTILR